MKIEDVIEHQNQLLPKWRNRVNELSLTISKYPWDRMERTSGDWRESEINGSRAVERARQKLINLKD